MEGTCYPSQVFTYKTGIHSEIIRSFIGSIEGFRFLREINRALEICQALEINKEILPPYINRSFVGDNEGSRILREICRGLELYKDLLPCL